MATKAKPFHNTDKYYVAKAIFDNIDVDEHRQTDIGGYVCCRAPLHKVVCQVGGYADEEGFKRHVLDQHLTEGSLRRYNSIVCNYRGLQRTDLRTHMNNDHPQYMRLRRKQPLVWNSFYNKLLMEQRTPNYLGFTKQSKNCTEVNEPFPAVDYGEEEEDDGVEAEDNERQRAVSEQDQVEPLDLRMHPDTPTPPPDNVSSLPSSHHH